MSDSITPHGDDRRPAAVVAIDIGGTKVDVAVARTDGAILRRARLLTIAKSGPAQLLDRIAAEVASARAELEHSVRITSYAAVSPGVIQDHGVLLAPNLPGWEHLPLAARLADALDVGSVAVGNDVRAGALAEARFGALAGADPGIYVSLGTGVSAALVVGGQVVDGAHNAAGEIAYTNVGLPWSSAPGRTPLEDLVGGGSFVDRAATALGTGVDAAELFGRTDPVSAHAVHQMLGVLADTVANLAVFCDPRRVVVGGGMMAAESMIIPVLRAHLDQIVPFPPELVPAKFTLDASLRGAIALAIDSDAETPAADKEIAS